MELVENLICWDQHWSITKVVKKPNFWASKFVKNRAFQEQNLSKLVENGTKMEFIENETCQSVQKIFLLNRIFHFATAI